MSRYFYTTKNLSEDLNGRIVCLNTRHEDHHNFEGPIEDDGIEARWLSQNGAA